MPCQVAYQAEYHKKRYQNDPEYAERHRKNGAEYSRRYKMKYRGDFRMEMIAAYGGACACCGETTPEFLTIDHVYDDGAEERKRIKDLAWYAWLRKNGYPKDRYQLLCWNCNRAKALLGNCPHQTRGQLWQGA